MRIHAKTKIENWNVWKLGKWLRIINTNPLVDWFHRCDFVCALVLGFSWTFHLCGSTSFLTQTERRSARTLISMSQAVQAQNSAANENEMPKIVTTERYHWMIIACFVLNFGAYCFKSPTQLPWQRVKLFVSILLVVFMFANSYNRTIQKLQQFFWCDQPTIGCRKLKLQGLASFGIKMINWLSCNETGLIANGQFCGLKHAKFDQRLDHLGLPFHNFCSYPCESRLNPPFPNDCIKWWTCCHTSWN